MSAPRQLLAKVLALLSQSDHAPCRRAYSLNKPTAKAITKMPELVYTTTLLMR